MNTKEKSSISAVERRQTRQTWKIIQKQAETEKKKAKWTQQPKNPFIRKGPQISPADIIVDTQLNKIKVEGEENSELANTTKQERASPLPFETQNFEEAFPSVEGTLVGYSLSQGQEFTTRPEEPSDNANSETEEAAVYLQPEHYIRDQNEETSVRKDHVQSLGFPSREEEETTNDFKTEIEKLQQMLKQKDDENALLVDENKKMKNDFLALAAPSSPGTSDLSAVNRRLWNLIGGKCAKENVELKKKNLEQQIKIHDLQKTVSLQTEIVDRLTSSNLNLTTEMASKDKMIQERLNDLKNEIEHLRSDISNLPLHLQTTEKNKLSLEVVQLETTNAKINELQTKIKSLEEERERNSSKRKFEHSCVKPSDSLDFVHVDVDPNFEEDTGFSSSVREMRVSSDHGVRINATTSSTENSGDRISPEVSPSSGEISVAATSTKRWWHSPAENEPPNRWHFCRVVRRQKKDTLMHLFDLTGYFGHNEIVRAVWKEKDLNELKSIVKQGSTISGTNVSDKAILHLAVPHHKDPEVIRFLIAVGADVNFADRSGYLPIHLLADVEHNFREKLLALCENGADINAKNGNGNTILHLAAYMRGEKEDIEYIVEKGGDWTLRNDDGQTVLHRAAEGGNPEVISYLIEIGMKVHAKDNFGTMPVHQACFAERNFKETLDVLMAHGAAINSTDKDGDTVLGIAARNARSKEDIKYIISKGGDLQAKNVRGESVLHTAAVGGNPEAIKCLIELGADVSLKDNSGVTPLNTIASTRHDFNGLLDVFLDAGVDINEQDHEEGTLYSRSVLSHKRPRADLEYIVQKGRSWKVKK